MPTLAIIFASLLILAAPIPQERTAPAALLGDTSPDKNESANLSFLQSQANLLRTRQVLESALRKPGVAGLLPLDLKEDPVAWLQERLRVDVHPQRRSLRVWVEDLKVDRRNQASLVNAIVDAYLEGVSKELRRPIEMQIKALDVFQELRRTQLEVQKAQLAAARAIARADQVATNQDKVERLEREIEEGDRLMERLRAQLRNLPRVTLLEKAGSEREATTPKEYIGK